MSAEAGPNNSSVELHNEKIQSSRQAWDRKPALREVYRCFYREIETRLRGPRLLPVVELGSGIGTIKEIIPDCITTDIFNNPWLDRSENAYSLSFADRSVGALVLFDVWHHLRYPSVALREFHRVLVPGGRVVLFEPAASILGRIVYGFFHHEGMDPRERTTWEAPEDFKPHKLDYYTDQFCATRVFWQHKHFDPARFAGWHVREVTPITSFAYWLQGGLGRFKFLPGFFHQAVVQFDRCARHFPRFCAARLLIVLEKAPN
jgi:SAM-dependent methyltransferase